MKFGIYCKVCLNKSKRNNILAHPSVSSSSLFRYEKDLFNLSTTSCFHVLSVIN